MVVRLRVDAVIMPMEGQEMSKTDSWPRNGRTAGQENLSEPQLKVWRGRVVSVTDRVASTTYTRQNGDHTVVNAVPEIWISDANGHETRFSHHLLAECRVGHELVIVGDPAKDRLLGFRNLSTEQTLHSGYLNDLPVNGGHVISMVTVGILLCSVAWILSVAMFGEVWERRNWWQRTAPDLLFYIALILAVLIPEKGRKWFNWRTERLRAQVDREIEAVTQ
jgi:hypothetical protein